MNIIENPAPVVPASTTGMLLHCGAQVVSRTDLVQTPTPEGSRTWFPLPHRDILHQVEAQLQATGFHVTEECHALSHEGARYFGVLSVQLHGRQEADYQWVVGLRNSHDRTYPAGLVAGTRVFVCDNLAFSGEVRISRKHTKFAHRDLRHLTARAVGQLGDRFRSLDQRVEAYKEYQVRDSVAHDVVVRAMDCAAITPSQVPDVLQEWRQPRYEAFESRNAWSLFNAFTEIHKSVNPHTVVRRGEALHGIFDGLVGLN